MTVIAALLGAAMAGIPRVDAATLAVTSTADSGAGTLRQALASAADGDTIDATGASGTILLTSGQLLVTNSITILGPGAELLAVDGNHVWCGNHYPCSTADSRVFLIGPVNTTIAGLTLTNGLAYAEYGGCIYSAGATLTVSNCTITGNGAWVGAGIFIDGSSFGSATLTVVNSTFTGNSAEGLGGGIFNDHSTLIVSNCTFNGNGDAASGGGIYNDGLGPCCAELSVSASTFSDNSGGIQNSSWAMLSVSACTFNGNGINNWIWNSSTGSVTVATSTFRGGGGIGNNSYAAGNALLYVSASTFSGGGGIGNYHEDFFPGNDGSAMLWVSACTFSDGSSIGNDGLFATLEIGDTILNGDGTINNKSGIVISRGYNLSSDGGGGFLTNAPDQINTDPMLGPLQDNGGPTFTHALLGCSPARDAGRRDTIKELALDIDQRGFPRPVGNPAVVDGDGSDIGAFEVQPDQGCTIHCPSDITTNTAPGLCGATVTFNACGSEACPSLVALPPSGSFFNTGTTPVTVTTNGVTVCTFNVTVNDTQPPTITCPANIITNVGLEVTSAVVTFSDPVASDNCGVASTTCSPPSGSTFGLGNTTVTCTALDTSGNTNSCTFNVILLQPPCPDLTGEWWYLVHNCKTTNAGLRCKVKAGLVIENIGTVAAPNSFVRYYLSSDGVQTNMFLKKVVTGTVKLGKPKLNTLSAKLPVGVSGSGRFIIAVMDAGNTVAECNEGNNIMVYGPVP